MNVVQHPTTTMPRFHQTVLPLEKMMKIWFQLSVLFGIVSFIETIMNMPSLEEQPTNKWVNMTQAYQNWTNTAVCDSSTLSKFMHEYPQVGEILVVSTAYFMIGSLRSISNIILPYYFTTYVISLYAS